MIDASEKLALRIMRDALDSDPGEREEFISRRCGGDTTLRRRVDALLRSVAEPPEADAPSVAKREPAIDLVDALLGAKLGPFRVVERIGRGGMGVVYRGERTDSDFAHTVAIKLIRRGFDFDDVQARFLRERRILARLHHPNLAGFVDGGVAPDGRPWFALEFVKGETITSWCDAKHLDVRARVQLMIDVCAAVQYAHTQLVIHRDLKPGNVLVDDSGNVRLLDFGIAKLLHGDEVDAASTVTLDGRYQFTPEYAAPEQFEGGSAGVAADVYALGAIAYRLITGVLPYPIERADLVASRALHEAPPQPPLNAIARDGTMPMEERLALRDMSWNAYRSTVRGDLTRILETVLAKEPQRRYFTVQAFADDLARWLAGAPVRVSGNRFSYRLGKFVKRNRVAVAVVAMLMLALLAASGLALDRAHSERLQRDLALVEAARADREALRAQAESARARVEVERLTAVNEFLSTVFSGADPNASGTPNVTLADALDHAVTVAESEFAEKPQLAVRVMLAAANSYDALGQPAKAESLVRGALNIQESKLPDSKTDRALLLSMLSFLRINYEPENALLWAQQAVNLQRSNEPIELNGLLDALSSLVAAQFGNDQIEAALATTQESLKLMRDSGTKETDPSYIGALSSVALIQGRLGHHDEAARMHEEVIRLRAQSVGADTVATWKERMFYAISLSKADRDAEALAQIDQALPGLERELGGDTPDVQQARWVRGMALVGLGRYAEAIAPLQSAHVFGRKNDFESRQSSVGYFYAKALAGLGRCSEAQTVAAELAQRKIEFPKDKNPFRDTRCPNPH